MKTNVSSLIKNPSFSTGDRIRLVRGLNGLSQIDLSRKLKNTSRWSLGRLENNKRQLQFEEIEEIAFVLNISPSWLVLGTYEDQEESYPENLTDMECAFILALREKNIEALSILVGVLAAGGLN